VSHNDSKSTRDSHKSDLRQKIVKAIASEGDGKPVHPLEICRRLLWQPDRVVELLRQVSHINADGDPPVIIVVSRNGLYLAERMDHYKEALQITRSNIRDLQRLRKRVNRIHK